MIQIKPTLLRNLDKIAEEHYQGVKSYVEANTSKLRTRQYTFITANLKDIITGKPKELASLYERYKTFCGKPGRERLKNIKQRLPLVFNYRWFTAKNAAHYNGYELAQKLSVNTCPYCNRNYTVTVAKGRDRTVRPDFDHFFPKSQYPLFALSFYNLIPSCATCNRTIKNQATIVYGKYIHPYEEGFDTALKINYFPKDTDSSLGIKTNMEIIASPNPLEPVKSVQCSNSFELFKLKEIYAESHGGEIADIIRKHVISNGKYLETMAKAFPKLGSINELYRIGFGNYYNQDDFEKRPLSKLTRDVVEQLVFSFPALTKVR